MAITVDGKPAGTAYMNLTPQPHGGLLQTTKIVTPNGRVLTENEWEDSQAMPTKQTMVATSNGLTVSVNVVYSGGSVVVTGSSGGKTRTFKIKLPPKVRSTPDFWFIRDHPKKGTSVDYFRLDPNLAAFKPSRDIYWGDYTVEYHGKNVKAHKVETTSAMQWLDDHGLPYRLEFKGKVKTVMVRQ
jgi:hypothetical protein